MTIATLWFNHLPNDKQEAFKAHILNESKNSVLERLKQIIVERRAGLEASERSTKVYDLNNWAYLQAHNNGMRQALKLVEDLLNFV